MGIRGLWIWGVGFGAWGLGFKVWGIAGFGVYGLGFDAQGLYAEFRVSALGWGSMPQAGLRSLSLGSMLCRGITHGICYLSIYSK